MRNRRCIDCCTVERVAHDVDALVDNGGQRPLASDMQKPLADYATGHARTAAAAASNTEHREQTHEVLNGHGTQALAKAVHRSGEAARALIEAERALAALPPSPVPRALAVWAAVLLCSATLAAVLGIFFGDALEAFVLLPLQHHVLQLGAASVEEIVDLLRLSGRAADELRATILAGGTDWSLEATRRWALGVGLALSLGLILIQTAAGLIAHKASFWSIVPAFVADVAFSAGYLFLRLPSFDALSPAPIAVTALELAILITHLAAVHRVGAVLHQWRAERAKLVSARNSVRTAAAQVLRCRREERALARWLRANAASADALQAERRADVGSIAKASADRATVRFLGTKQANEETAWDRLEAEIKEDLSGYPLH